MTSSLRMFLLIYNAFALGNNMCYILDQIENRGRLEGKEEGRQEIILKMLESNLPDEQIKTYTGVTPKELEKIKEKVACAVTE